MDRSFAERGVVEHEHGLACGCRGTHRCRAGQALVGAARLAAEDPAEMQLDRSEPSLAEGRDPFFSTPTIVASTAEQHR